jgi:hypothetical protein
MSYQLQFGRININGPTHYPGTHSSQLTTKNAVILPSKLPDDEIYFSDYQDYYSDSPKPITSLSPKILLKEPIILTNDIVKKGYEVKKIYPKGTSFNSLQDLAYELSLDLDPTNGMEKWTHEHYISEPIRKGDTKMILSELKQYRVACRFDPKFWRKFKDYPVTPYPWLNYSVRQWLKLKSGLNSVANSISAHLPNALKSNH